MSWPVLVFVNRNGEPQKWSSAALRMALDRARVPQIRVQDLRHTTTTVVLEAGAHPQGVAQVPARRMDCLGGQRRVARALRKVSILSGSML